MDYMNTDNIIKKSFTILKEMLNDRDEDITKIENMTEEELLSFYTNSSIFDIEVNDKLKIIYNITSKIKIQDIRKFINIDEENEKNDLDKTIIFISKEKLTTNNFKSFNEYKNKVNLQFFYIKELLFNIYRHELVPKHDVISSNEEIKKIMDKYLMKNKFQFPLILHTDPVCKYLNIKINIKSNSLVKITRPSPTSGEYILYRYVV